MRCSIKILTLIFSIFVFSVVSCASNDVIPNDLTAKQLIQKGQDAFDNNKYKLSLRYFNTALERFGETDIQTFIEAKYEIGHIYMKQKKYNEAKVIFNEIVYLYSKTFVGQIPGAYLKLAKIELAKIPGNVDN